MDAKMLEAAIRNYVHTIKTRKSLTNDEVAAMIKLLTEQQRQIKDEVRIFDVEIKQVREPLIEEVGAFINEMPDMEKYDSNPMSYYNPINQNRFATLGFRVHEVVYKRTQTWDWQPVTVGILVPESLDLKREVGVHVKWHGGAFGSSGWDFEPWFGGHYLRHAEANNAILVAPNYRLMPEAVGKDILEDVDDFLAWFNGNSTPNVHGSSFTTAIKSLNPNIVVNLDRLVISGDSAGSFLAVYSWLKYSGVIRALYLTYPMLNYYEWPMTGPEFVYRGCPVTKAWSDANADKIHAAIHALEKDNLVPTMTKRTPPDGCPSNFKLGFTGKWKDFFRRGCDTQDVPGMIGEMLAQNKTPNSLPPIFIHQGHDDPQCPIANTKAFVETLKTTWYNACPDKVQLVEVKKIESRKVGQEEVGHGYDHDLDEAEETWLRKMLKDISEAWNLHADYT
ncbi:hypothetical protein N0V90_000056 [Kalmusia sp. IMI 367209]|nr:hypothetical protein N0V90_000056 [Kalmusia sp. IMI 367209]